MDKLYLKKEMERTWLIQRLQKPHLFNIGGKQIDNPFSFGGGLINGGLPDGAMGILRNVWSFDYMGSAEFEWGAVPSALQFLAGQASANNLVIGQTETGKQEIVYYITPKSYETEVINRIQLIRHCKIDLKERAGLDNFFESEQEYARRNVGWLELDNGFLFFTDKEMFDNTCRLFGLGIEEVK